MCDIGTYACKFQISIFFSFNVFISTFEILFPTFLHRKFDLVVYLEIQSNLLVTLSILPVRAFLFFFCTLIKRKFSDFFSCKFKFIFTWCNFSMTALFLGRTSPILAKVCQKDMRVCKGICVKIINDGHK